MTTETTYIITASNDQGAYTVAGIDYGHPYGGRQYTSISAAVKAARHELGSGWHVQIINTNDGSVVKAFTIR
jgi:hypothetical protein